MHVGTMATIVVASFVTSFFNQSLGAAVIRRRHARAAADAAAGRPVRVSAYIRVPGQGLAASRWRQGKMVIFGGDIVWAPRRPRIGRRLQLHGVVLDKPRSLTSWERWRLVPHTVVVPCVAEDQRHELAVFPAAVAYLRASQS